MGREAATIAIAIGTLRPPLFSDPDAASDPDFVKTVIVIPRCEGALRHQLIT
jgi:hypothetical protein